MGEKTRYNIITEEATADDVKSIYEIGCRCFPDAWREETIKNDMDGAHSRYFTAKIKEKTVGYGCFWFVADEAQLVNIGVLPAFRRNGIAEEILKRGILEAVSRHMQTMFLEVRISNLAAQNLYRKYNFQVVSVRKDVYELPKENGYIMSCPL